MAYTGIFRTSHKLFCKPWFKTLCSVCVVRTTPAAYHSQKRPLSTTMPNRANTFQVQCLTNRTLIRFSGSDTSELLQGLLTNDMECLHPRKVDCGKTLYTLMLNVQGRVLYDMILYAVGKQKTGDTANATDIPQTDLLMECDVTVVEELIKTLKRFKIRKKVSITPVGDELRVWAVVPPDDDPQAVPVINCDSVVMCEPDPRLKALGHRLILPTGINASSVLIDAEEITKESVYIQHRYRLGVAEGSAELPTGNCLPLESNAAFLNGVSFNKGCYIGQELTARTFHTGLTRKRIMPLSFNSKIETTLKVSVKNAAGKNCGMLRGHCGVMGLGLLRIPDTIGKGPLTLTVAEKEDALTKATTHIPGWWPLDTDSILKQVTTDYPNVVSTKSN